MVAEIWAFLYFLSLDGFDTSEEFQGVDTLNPDLDGELRDWMGESQSQQCGVRSLNHCKAFSMDGTHSAATLCCNAPSSHTNRTRSHCAM